MSRFDVERIADALKPEGSRFARRNRLIKAALAEEFGWGNVSVRGDRGTAYGWVNIKVRVKKPHSGECDLFCPFCRDFRDKVRARVWQILKQTGLDREIGTYYSDVGDERKECIIDVELIP
jgi:hypothetical protein